MFHKNTRLLFSLYILSLPFINLLNLPLLNTKVQPPELIFLISISYLLFNIKKIDFSAIQWHRLDQAILIYVGACFISCLAVQQRQSWLEWIGLVYLVGVYGFGKLVLSQWQEEALSKYIIKVFTITGLIAACSGIIGWWLSQYGIDNPMAWSSASYYPYLGYIRRATGFMITPNMLASLLIVVLVLKTSTILYKKQLTQWEIITLSLLLLGLFLTFSRMIILVAIGGLLLMYFHKTVWKKWQKLGWGTFIFLLFIIFNFGTHFLLVNTTSTKWEQLTGLYASEENIIFSNEKYALALTPYSILKRSSFEIGKRHFPFGIGAGRSNQYLPVLVQEGKYPTTFENFDPHSTYFGAFAEVGLFGLMALLFLFFTIGKTLYQLLKKTPPKAKNLGIGLTICFTLISIEAIAIDTMNFRHYWILLALLGVLENGVTQNSPNPKSNHNPQIPTPGQPPAAQFHKFLTSSSPHLCRQNHP